MEKEGANCLKSQWLSKEHFQHLINKKYPETIVKSVSSSQPSSKLIDILCNMYICNSLVELHSSSGTEIKPYQVKLPEQRIFSVNLLFKDPFFGLDREVRVLSKIVEVMERNLTAIAPGKFEPLASTLVDYQSAYTIIEDDHGSNFSVLANEKGVDLKHCLAFIRFIAVFHASSIPVLKELPHEVLDIHLLPDTDVWYLIEDVIEGSLVDVIAQLELWEDGQAWIEKIRTLSGKLVDRYEKSFRRQPDRFSVLVHGFPSGDRVLFRADSEKPGCRLRGFEFSRAGSFADDILHFIYRAASDDVLESHTDLLVEEYRTAFNEALDLLGLEVEKLSAEEIRAELKAQRAVALVMAFHELPHVRTPGFLDEWTAGQTHEPVYKCPEYIKLLRSLLITFDCRGWLDGIDDSSAEEQASSSSLPTT